MGSEMCIRDSFPSAYTLHGHDIWRASGVTKPARCAQLHTAGQFARLLNPHDSQKLPFFTFHLTRTRHSAREQSYQAHKLCPATDIIDLFLAHFGSVFLVLRHATIISPRRVSIFSHFGTLPTLPEHEVRSASRVTATQKTMFAAATVVPCRLKWEGWLCVMLCVFVLFRSANLLSEASRSDKFSFRD